MKITFPGGVTIEHERDGLSRAEFQILTDVATNEVASIANTFDNENHLTSQTRNDGASSYDYDNLYRLIQSSELGEAYTYDGVGNRVTSQASTSVWTYNTNHQLLTTPDVTYTYNTNGHRSTQTRGSETLTYSYNLEEQLVQISSDQSGVVASYSYDPFGRRLTKTVGSTTTYYYYNETGLVGEYDAAGQLIQEFHYMPDSLWMSNPLFKRDGDTDELHYYLNDHIGTPKRLFNQSGQITWSATYESFGAVFTGTERTSNPLRFSGQYFDAESDLHYNYLRYYDPSIGRYIEEDPIGLVGGLSLYGYANSNPVRFIDPYGLIPYDKFTWDNFSLSDPTSWPEASDSFTNKAAGFGDGVIDTLSIGLVSGETLRGIAPFDGNKVVEQCSPDYLRGELVGISVGTVVSLGGAARSAARTYRARAKAQAWPDHSRQRKKTKRKKIEQAGNYREAVASGVFAIIGGWGVNSWQEVAEQLPKRPED